jgi:hypothetical protein
MGVFNGGKIDKYLIDNNIKHHLPPEGSKIFQATGDFESMTIRDTDMPLNVAYMNLSHNERDLYIPKVVTQGTLRIINSTVYNDWVLATDHPYRGTMTYIPTNDKDFHMMDKNGNKYCYGVDHFRQLIPHLNAGVANGSFKYVGRGTRHIKYVLVPCDMESTDLVLCYSSDSDLDLDLDLGSNLSMD